MPPFDNLKDRSDGCIGRRRGSVIQSARTGVAKRQHPPKNSTIRFCLKTGSQCQCGLIARKNPLEVALQLLMFRCYVSTGTIGVLLLRFRFQQVDHFVGALWICSKFSAMGTSANIR